MTHFNMDEQAVQLDRAATKDGKDLFYMDEQDVQD
jgi:hypothetical protein